jgi:NAD(P)-dependent dehydrogenase (short-subunit alcohol dehydrogenase family)
MELPRTPSLRLDGRRALVTGAGRGIGLACAAALAQAGAHVVLAALTTSEIDEVTESIRRTAGPPKRSHWTSLISMRPPLLSKVLRHSIFWSTTRAQTGR